MALSAWLPIVPSKHPTRLITLSFLLGQLLITRSGNNNCSHFVKIFIGGPFSWYCILNQAWLVGLSAEILCLASSETNVKNGLAFVGPDFLLVGSLFFPLHLCRAVVPSAKATESEVLQVQLSTLRKPAVVLDQWLRRSASDHKFAGSILVSLMGVKLSTSANMTFSAWKTTRCLK